MNLWVRLWLDMPTDPKWRVIAKRAGRSISEVMSVYVFMLANAGERNEHDSERGELSRWSDEDVAAALDVETSVVTTIREAMQGKTLDGTKLTGWKKRQPKREDSSAERAKEWRERKRTQTNAGKRPDPDSEKKEDNPLPSEQDAARVEKGKIEKIVGVGLGPERHDGVSPAAKRQVARALNVATVEPLLEVFEEWRKGRIAKTSLSAWFISSAVTLWKNNPSIHAACRPLEPDPLWDEPLSSAQPSAALVSNLRKSRHAN